MRVATRRRLAASVPGGSQYSSRGAAGHVVSLVQMNPAARLPISVRRSGPHPTLESNPRNGSSASHSVAKCEAEHQDIAVPSVGQINDQNWGRCRQRPKAPRQGARTTRRTAPRGSGSFSSSGGRARLGAGLLLRGALALLVALGPQPVAAVDCSQRRGGVGRVGWRMGGGRGRGSQRAQAGLRLGGCRGPTPTPQNVYPHPHAAHPPPL